MVATTISALTGYLAIDFLIRDHRIQPVIRDEAYDLTDHSQGQMLTRVGIPAQFAPKLMDLEENELLSRNLKRLTERMEEGGILLRRVGTTIIGWLSPAYKRGLHMGIPSREKGSESD